MSAASRAAPSPDALSTASRSPQAALLRQPWQLRRGSWYWLAPMPLLLALPPLVVALNRGLGPLPLLCLVGLLWLAGLWWLQADGLLRQNQPQAARLVPGHAAALRQSLLWQALLTTVVGFGLLSLLSEPRVLWLWLIVPLLVLTTWLQREPLLWLPLTIASPWLPELREMPATAAGLPPLVQLAALGACAALLAASIGGGGAWHRWTDARQRRWRRTLKAQSEGRATPVPRSPLARALQRCFDWPQRLWRQRLLTAPRPSALARLDLGLGTGGQWPMLLWIAGLIAAGVLTTLGLVVRPQMPDWTSIIDNARFGLCIGLFSMAAGALHGRLGRLWERRREQALLVLLPGLPPVAALEARWRREYLLAWGMASCAVLGITAFGSPGSLDFAAACAALCLPLAWISQYRQRRLRATPRLPLENLVPPLAAVLAYQAQTQGLPAWASLAAGALVYALCAWRADARPLQLPVARGR